MARAKTTKTTKSVKTTKTITAEKYKKPRRRQLPSYKSFRLQKKIPHPAGPVPGIRDLVCGTNKLVWENRWPLLALFGLFVFFTLAFVRGFTSPFHISELKTQIQEVLGGDNKWSTTIALFSSMVGNQDASDNAGLYQFILVIIFGLAIIWLFRQFSAGNKPTAKEALFKGMYPIVPLLCVLFMMALQCIPAYVGTSIYSATIGSGIAVTFLEQFIWTLLSVGLVLLTGYWLLSSLFALYVVTLPDMTPFLALRTSKNLVFSRRFTVIVRLLGIALVFALLLILIVIPAIYFVAPIAPWLYLGLSVLFGLYVHAYLFNLYKELL